MISSHRPPKRPLGEIAALAHEAGALVLVDGAQAILPDEFEALMDEVRALAAAIGRDVAAVTLEMVDLS